MELERRQRRKDRKAVVAEDVRSIHDLSDDLLRQILLGLDSPLWLIRSSSACKRWRHIVTGEGDDADQGRAFLRLARSLHPPTVVGQYHNRIGVFDHRFVPSSPLPAPIDISRFSVDDIILGQKSLWTWHVGDCHGGLVLLRRGGIEPSLKVYDPLTRQHHLIYSPPLLEQVDRHGGIDIFLLDGDNGDISISNFKVFYRFCRAKAHGGPLTCVFSALNGWGENSSFQKPPADNATGYMRQFAGRVDGCLYVGLGMGSVIALDNASLLFAKVELPIRIRLDTLSFSWPSTFAVVHSSAGRLGPTSPATAARTTTSIVHVCGKELELFRRVNGSGEWVLEHSIANLSEATRGLSTCLDKCMRVIWRAMVDAIAEDGTGLAILLARADGRRWFFSIDVHTMEMRALPEETDRVLPDERYGRNIFNYTLPWPHFLRACP